MKISIAMTHSLFFYWMERNSPEEILSWLNAQDEERRKDLVTAIGGKVKDWERLE